MYCKTESKSFEVHRGSVFNSRVLPVSISNFLGPDWSNSTNTCNFYTKHFMSSFTVPFSSLRKPRAIHSLKDSLIFHLRGVTKKKTHTRTYIPTPILCLPLSSLVCKTKKQSSIRKHSIKKREKTVSPNKHLCMCLC